MPNRQQNISSSWSASSNSKSKSSNCERKSSNYESKRSNSESKSSNSASNNTAQPLIPLMIRTPVPEHVRANLRASAYSQQPHQRPPPNYHNALQTMTQTIQNQYAQPSQSQLEYGARQTQFAEHGFPPPNITPPTILTPLMPELTISHSASGYEQWQQQPPPDLWPIHVPAPSPTQPPPDIRPIDVPAPSLTQSASRQRSVSDLAQVAERMAFNIDPITGLNGFGMLSGYMPANVVDMIPGAWDRSGRMLWLPRAIRAGKREERSGVVVR